MTRTLSLPFDVEPVKATGSGQDADASAEPPLLTTYTEEDIRVRERLRRALEAEEARWRQD